MEWAIDSFVKLSEHLNLSLFGFNWNRLEEEENSNSKDVQSAGWVIYNLRFILILSALLLFLPVVLDIKNTQHSNNPVLSTVDLDNSL